MDRALDWARGMVGQGVALRNALEDLEQGLAASIAGVDLEQILAQRGKVSYADQQLADIEEIKQTWPSNQAVEFFEFVEVVVGDEIWKARAYWRRDTHEWMVMILDDMPDWMRGNVALGAKKERAIAALEERFAPHSARGEQE